jgi:hypothetical protein
MDKDRIKGSAKRAIGAMLAEEAFAISAERLLARIDNPKRKRRPWR